MASALEAEPIASDDEADDELPEMREHMKKQEIAAAAAAGDVGLQLWRRHGFDDELGGAGLEEDTEQLRGELGV